MSPVYWPAQMTPDQTTRLAGNERNRRAMLSTITSSGFGYLMTALSFVAVPLYLKWLGVAAYGRFLTLLAFMGYLNFADAGLNWGALVLIGQAHGRQDKPAVASLFRHAVVLAWLSAALALFLAVLVYLATKAGYRLPMFSEGPAPGISLLLIGLKSGFMLSISGCMAMAYGLQEGFWFARIQGYFQLLGVGLMLAAAYWLRDIDAVVAASTLSSGLACGVTLFLAGRRYREYLALKARLSLESFKIQLRMGAKSFLLQGSRLVRTTLPLFLIASFVGSSEVPMLTLPMTLLGVVGGFLFNWSASLQTAYGEAWAKGDKRWIAATLCHVIERGLGWLSLAACLIAVLGQSFVSIWTRDHVVVPPVLLASAIALTVSSWMTDVCIFALVGINRQRRIALFEVLNVLLGGAAGAFLCYTGRSDYIGFGVLGASVVTTIWASRSELSRWLETKGFAPAWPLFARFAVTSLCTLTVLLFLRVVWGGSENVILAWAKITVIGIVGCATFLASSAAVGLRSEQWPGFDWVAFVRRKKMARGVAAGPA